MSRRTVYPIDDTTQAGRVIRRFGGVRRLAMATAIHYSAIYRWVYPKDAGGTGGHIPAAALGRVLAAARHEGIFLAAEDLDPRPAYLD